MSAPRYTHGPGGTCPSGTPSHALFGLCRACQDATFADQDAREAADCARSLADGLAGRCPVPQCEEPALPNLTDSRYYRTKCERHQREENAAHDARIARMRAPIVRTVRGWPVAQ